MTKANVHLARWSADPEWHVQLTATNGFIATAIDFYTEAEHVEPFASALTTFPRYQHDETSFELGRDLGRWAYHVYLRAYVFDAVGRSALEILTEIALLHRITLAYISRFVASPQHSTSLVAIFSAG